MNKTILSLDRETYKIEDLQGENISLLQHVDDVEYFNREYGLDYNYYFVAWIDDCADKLFGSYTCALSDTAYYVKEL